MESSEAAPAQPSRHVLRQREEVSASLANLLGHARHQISVFGPQLDPALFNVGAITHLLASFAAHHRHNRARFLIEDTDQVRHDNARLIELCRRMSEFVDIRQVGEEHVGLREFFVVVDRSGYLHQGDITRPEFVIDPHGPAQAAQLLMHFDAMWARSEPILEIRTIGL